MCFEMLLYSEGVQKVIKKTGKRQAPRQPQSQGKEIINQLESTDSR